MAPAWNHHVLVVKVPGCRFHKCQTPFMILFKVQGLILNLNPKQPGVKNVYPLTLSGEKKIIKKVKPGMITIPGHLEYA
jgi:hypothetical protein